MSWVGGERARRGFRGDRTSRLARPSPGKMTARFDKRAMGHPLPNTDPRPTLSSFQDEVAASERARRTRTTSAGNNSAAAGEAVDALAEKVKELDFDELEAAQAQDDGRSLEVSRFARFRWRKVGSQVGKYSFCRHIDPLEARRNDYLNPWRRTMPRSLAFSTVLSSATPAKWSFRCARLTLTGMVGKSCHADAPESPLRSARTRLHRKESLQSWRVLTRNRLSILLPRF